ncbi:MAG: hypothetical protein Q4D78_06895 [Neisseria zoodegmatis]|uniref:DUF6973 domain-containing protein n=1 Tax=Neisseria zoodegmatis TaxID=326523 RepID=UPI0026EB1E75|nr:hypothetical protein [Neisseria zoodegmatis]MDO5069910.1 hypothetical protein [Neisseria zoodegmatis]
MKRITLLAVSLLLSACHINDDESRRSKILRFIAQHPVAAQAIGLEDGDSTNLTSNAARFAKLTGLNDTANGKGKGTQVNAVRNALWQAAITSRFGSEIAEKAGNASEHSSSIREGKTEYFSRSAADLAVDLRNNRVGRQLGASNPNMEMKALSQIVLAHFYKDGLWTAKPVTEKGRRYWRISRTKISRTDYQTALNNLKLLNNNGFTEEEQIQHDAQKPNEIKQTIKVISGQKQ